MDWRWKSRYSIAKENFIIFEIRCMMEILCIGNKKPAIKGNRQKGEGRKAERGAHRNREGEEEKKKRERESELKFE